MTIAAVILAASPASALADADGTPAVRRMADTAWAGGATPVVVCAPDPGGAVAAALATAEVTIVAPAAPELGPVAQIANGVDAAVRLVGATGAALVWPARYAWVDAETVTTLIAAHGEDGAPLLRPSFHGRPGWPALLPVGHLDALRALGADRMPDDLLDDLAAAGVPVRVVETGDPGTTHDLSVPRATLPAYDGPPEPEDGLPREWGVPAADEPDDAPLAGPPRLDPAGPAG
jgi:CTP:molybdopterin cytidylyltransferase MocA